MPTNFVPRKSHNYTQQIERRGRSFSLDVNEVIYKKSIGKALTDRDGDGLAMKEVVGEFTGIPIGPTFFRGSKPIDEVLATSDIVRAWPKNFLKSALP